MQLCSGNELYWFVALTSLGKHWKVICNAGVLQMQLLLSEVRSMVKNYAGSVPNDETAGQDTYSLLSLCKM